jgi:antitoxin ParD1/3/4
MMGKVSRRPDLEAFAEQCVASGRYGDLESVVDAGLALLREREKQRAAFVASLEAAEREADEKGWLEIEEVIAALDADEAAERAQEETARRSSP